MPGLSKEAVVQSRAAYGRNVFAATGRSGLWLTLKEVVTEPMFVLLLAACGLYFGVGRREEAITLIVALLAVAGISVYQSLRSDRALAALLGAGWVEVYKLLRSRTND
ncbi:cation-transporting P-type ATPase [Hymenobacter ruber]